MANFDPMPFLAMVIVQVGYAGMSFISKLAMDDGIHPFVLVTYRQIIATVATTPFALLLERKTRPKITVPILFHIFLCSITGAFMNQVFFFVGLNNSSPMIAGAMTNTLLPVTFVFALIFGQESFGIKTKAGRAKVIGTLLCVGGAMLLSFYHGHTIAGSNSGIHWKYAEEMTNKRSIHKSHSFLGPCLLFCSTSSWALWFIIQAKLSPKFPAPYTTTTLMCLMASIECLIVGAASEHNVAAWSLRSVIRLIAVFYAGVVCSAVAFCVMIWCVHRKGPLYTSVFSPLLLVMSTLLSWALLREKLYVGTLVGAVFIIVGLYSVLWGKGKDAEEARINDAVEASAKHHEKEDSESQLHLHANGESRQDPK
ncbi:WAT1-related protein At1g09380-like [Rhodamnia argentea]|uniref:WAT1-related protein n=1 Tax=Rhodamnia argentea TaxID=178133 RepID=A0A8B8P4F4_9MYRT|nr:WAT1-related protein At1g09380-like [Rhodamnia argentea]